MVIRSDSLSCLEMLRNSACVNPIGRKILERLGNSLDRFRFYWVKAHTGIEGHELADRLAKDSSADINLSISYDRVLLQYRRTLGEIGIIN